MKTFLAVYLGQEGSFEKWKAMDEDKKKEMEEVGMQAWMKWAADNQESIVDGGAPLGKTKRISKDGISDIKNEMSAYTIVRAESHEEAAKMFENHPHFTHFPGHSVEVMECMPMPKM